MAITVTQLVGTSTAGGYATSVSTAPWTPAAGKLLIARACAIQSGNAPGKITIAGNGLTWIRLADDLTVGNFRVVVFCAWSASATAGVTTLTSTESDQLELKIFEAEGVRLGQSGFAAIRQCVVGHAITGTALTVNLRLAPLGSHHAILAFCDSDTTASFTPEGSWTELYDTGHAAAVYREDTTDGSIAFTSSGSCAKIAVAIELYADDAPTEAIIRPFGSASNPIGGYSTAWENSTTPVVVVPPVGMQTGDLVIMAAATRDVSGVSMAVSAAGGQTWTALSPQMLDTYDGTYPAACRLFHCTFNGTWGSDPSIAITGGTAPHSAVMRVYRPPATITTWAVHQALTETDFASGVTRTVTGQATTVDLAVQLVVAATAITGCDILLSVAGDGWAFVGSFMNTYTGDIALHVADRVVVGASSAEDVDLTYYGGGGSDTTGIITFEAQIVVGALGGDAAFTLDDITLTAEGSSPTTGAAAITLDAITLAGVGAVGAYGAAAITLDAITLQGVGISVSTTGSPNPCGEPGDDYPKMEGRYTVPAAGLRMTVDINGSGPLTFAVLSGGSHYYPTAVSSDTSTFLGSIAAVLNIWLAAGGVWTLTADDEGADGDDATGKITIAHSLHTFDVTWIDTELRDLLGFTADLSGAASYEGAACCRNIWLPDRRRWLPPDPEGSVGRPVPNTSILISSSGHSVALDFGVRYGTSIEFHHVAGKRVRKELEVIANQSFQSFFENVVAKGEPIRYHYDRSDDWTFVTWRMMPVALPVAPDVPGWTGIGCAGAETYYGIGPVDVVEYLAP